MSFEFTCIGNALFNPLFELYFKKYYKCFLNLNFPLKPTSKYIFLTKIWFD